MEKAKRFYILFNHVGISPGYANINIAINNYNRKVKSNGSSNKVSLMVRTDCNTEVELLSNKQVQPVSTATTA